MKRNQYQTRSKQQHRRRGSLMIILMICLLLLSVLGGSLVRIGMTQRKQARRESDRLQAIWLAESGVERAAAMLRQDSAYTGEEWTLDKDQITGQFGGDVEIKVKSDASNTNRRIITVTATYPVNTVQQTRSSKAVSIDLAP